MLSKVYNYQFSQMGVAVIEYYMYLPTNEVITRYQNVIIYL